MPFTASVVVNSPGKASQEEYCTYIVQESKGLLLYSANTWEKNSTDCFKLAFVSRTHQYGI